MGILHRYRELAKECFVKHDLLILRARLTRDPAKVAKLVAQAKQLYLTGLEFLGMARELAILAN